MWSTPSLPSLPGLLGLGVVAPDRILSMVQIEMNSTTSKLNCLKLTILTSSDVFKLRTYDKLNCLK